MVLFNLSFSSYMNKCAPRTKGNIFERTKGRALLNETLLAKWNHVCFLIMIILDCNRHTIFTRSDYCCVNAFWICSSFISVPLHGGEWVLPIKRGFWRVIASRRIIQSWLTGMTVDSRTMLPAMEMM